MKKPAGGYHAWTLRSSGSVKRKSPLASGIVLGRIIRGERGDDHSRSVVADDEIKATDAAPIDAVRLRLIVTSGSQFTTNRRTTGWALPRHRHEF